MKISLWLLSASMSCIALRSNKYIEFMISLAIANYQSLCSSHIKRRKGYYRHKNQLYNIRGSLPVPPYT